MKLELGLYIGESSTVSGVAGTFFVVIQGDFLVIENERTVINP